MYLHLADEPWDEQQHQDAVMVSSVTKEGLGHEGGEERHVSVGLTHLHLPQLHLDGLNTDDKNKNFKDESSHSNSGASESCSLFSGVSDLGVGLRLCKLDLEVKHLSRWLLLQLS